MTIEELIKEKAALEKRLTENMQNEINAFSEKTGTVVSDVRINMITEYIFGDRRPTVSLLGVICTVEI